MSGSIASSAQDSLEDEDRWPWQCLDCETTIYHDVEFCRDCAPAHRPASDTAQLHPPEGFFAWIRRESVPTFVLKTTVIAGIELSLMTLWLQVMLVGPSALSRVGPIVT